MSHGHSHGAHSCSSEHNHDDDLPEGQGPQEWSLYQYINTSQVYCLNESEPGAILNCFKPFSEKYSTDKYVESNEDDEQLIIHIPFTGPIHLVSFSIIGGTSGKAPAKIRVWKNRSDINFSNATTAPPVQTFELIEDCFETLPEYRTNFAKFQNVTNLTFFIEDNFGADNTLIYYIGFKGQFTQVRKDPLGIVYELRPQFSDHKQEDDKKVGHHNF